MNPQLQALQRRVGRFPIEYPTAAMLAAAVAFATMALPQWRFEQAVAATGLPDVVAAAAPPLGQTARVLVALLLGALSFVAVMALLRALDRRPEPTDFPVFRTEDLHPDAPKRRPILAGAEFGAPAADLPPLGKQETRKPVLAEPLPSFMAPQPPEIGDFVPAPAIAQVRPVEVRPAAQPRPAPAPEPDFAEFEEIEPVAPAAVSRAVEARAIDPFEAPLRASALPSFMDSEVAKAADAYADGDSDFGFEEPVRQEEPAGLSELMSRLEAGLARSGGKPPVPRASGAGRADLARALGALEQAPRR